MREVCGFEPVATAGGQCLEATMIEYTKWELAWLSKNVSYYFDEDRRRPKLMGAHIYKPPRGIYDRLGGIKKIGQ